MLDHIQGQNGVGLRTGALDRACQIRLDQGTARAVEPFERTARDIQTDRLIAVFLESIQGHSPTTPGVQYPRRRIQAEIAQQPD